MPTEKEVLSSLRRQLPELLPTLRVAVERPSQDSPWDLVLKVQSGRRTRRLVFEVKAVGEPRYLAQAITSLTLAVRKNPRIYPVVVAPYISPEGRRLCREAGVGYLDLTGNVFLRFDGILVDRLEVKGSEVKGSSLLEVKGSSLLLTNSRPAPRLLDPSGAATEPFEGKGRG